MDHLDKIDSVAKDTVLWAIDPLAKPPAPDKLLMYRLSRLFAAAAYVMQPVEVVETTVVPPTKANERKLNAAGYLLELGISGAEPTIIIAANSKNANAEVTALLAFAENAGTKCIMVTSHGRSGIERSYFGSFAEDLLKQSKYPVLFLNDVSCAQENQGPITRAIFPTDFSENSKRAFNEFLVQANRLKVKITVFNAVSLPAIAAASEYGVPVIIPADYFSDQIKFAKQEGALWLQHAESCGVEASLIVEYEGIGSGTEEDIRLVAVRERADLIVMSTTAGPVANLFFGNIARDCFRRHCYPVWVYGPQSLRN